MPADVESFRRHDSPSAGLAGRVNDRAEGMCSVPSWVVLGGVLATERWAARAGVMAADLGTSAPARAAGLGVGGLKRERVAGHWRRGRWDERNTTRVPKGTR